MKYLVLLLLCGCVSTSPVKHSKVETVSSEIGFNLAGYSGFSPPIRDYHYTCLSIAQVKSLGTIDVSGKEGDDCDDAAYKMADRAWTKFKNKEKGLAFGVVYVKANDDALRKFLGNPKTDPSKVNWHALNIFIGENKEPYFFEPQTGVVEPVYGLVEIGFLEIFTYVL